MPAGRPPIYPAMAKRMKKNEVAIVASTAADLRSLTLVKELKKLGRTPQVKRVRGKVHIWWN